MNNNIVDTKMWYIIIIWAILYLIDYYTLQTHETLDLTLGILQLLLNIFDFRHVIKALFLSEASSIKSNNDLFAQLLWRLSKIANKAFITEAKA